MEDTINLGGEIISSSGNLTNRSLKRQLVFDSRGTKFSGTFVQSQITDSHSHNCQEEHSITESHLERGEAQQEVTGLHPKSRNWTKGAFANACRRNPSLIAGAWSKGLTQKNETHERKHRNFAGRNLDREDCFTNRTTTIKFAFMVMLLLIGQSSIACNPTLTNVSVDTTATATAMPQRIWGGLDLMDDPLDGPLWAGVTLNFGAPNDNSLVLFNREGVKKLSVNKTCPNPNALVLKDPLKLFIGDWKSGAFTVNVWRAALTYGAPTWVISPVTVMPTTPATVQPIQNALSWPSTNYIYFGGKTGSIVVVDSLVETGAQVADNQSAGESYVIDKSMNDLVRSTITPKTFYIVNRTTFTVIKTFTGLSTYVYKGVVNNLNELEFYGSLNGASSLSNYDLNAGGGPAVSKGIASVPGTIRNLLNFGTYNYLGVADMLKNLSLIHKTSFWKILHWSTMTAYSDYGAMKGPVLASGRLYIGQFSRTGSYNFQSYYVDFEVNCLGRDASKVCSGCAGGLYRLGMDPWNICISDSNRPPNYGRDLANMVLYPCATGCNNCVSDYTVCTLCDYTAPAPNDYWLDTNTNTCVLGNNIGSGFGRNASNGLAFPCLVANCSNCQVSYLVCTACVLPWRFDAGMCCPSGQYNNSGTCSSCPTNCDTCTSSSVCMMCNPTFILTSGVCACPIKTYENGGECSACSSNCQVCSSLANCSICDATFSVGNGSCQCLSSEFSDEVACHQCPATCLTCSSATVCLSCATNRTLVLGDCCLSNQYHDGLQCQDCHLSCHACSGPDQDDCTSCPSGQFKDGTQCLSVCPNSKYANQTSECLPCHPNCLTCQQEPAKCTSCAIGSTLAGNTCTNCNPPKVKVGTECLNVYSQQYVGKFDELISTIEIDLKDVFDPEPLSDKTLSVALYSADDQLMKGVLYLQYEWKPSNDGFTINCKLNEDINKGYFLISQNKIDPQLQPPNNRIPMFLNRNTVIPVDIVFKVENVNYNRFKSTYAKTQTVVANSVGSASGALLLTATPFRASMGTAIQKIANMFENIIYYNTIRVRLPDFILDMVGHYNSPIQLPNIFEVSEDQINCTPASNYVAHDVSCNILNNYGEELLFQIIIVGISGLVSVAYYFSLKKLTRDSWIFRLLNFLYMNYGPSFLFINLEGNSLEILGFSILNIVNGNGALYQIIGLLVSLVMVSIQIAIIVLGYKFLKEFEDVLPGLRLKYTRDIEKDIKAGNRMTEELVQFRKDSQFTKMTQKIGYHYMRFIIEDYRLDLKGVYYMTPLLTIVKNFISQLIVILLTGKGMIQVFLMLVVNVGFTAYYIKASPYKERISNATYNLTHILFSLYTLLVLVVNSYGFTDFVLQTIFGMIMAVILITIVFINVVYIGYSIFSLFRNLFRAICGKKAPLVKQQMKEILKEADLIDYRSLSLRKKQEIEKSPGLEGSESKPKHQMDVPRAPMKTIQLRQIMNLGKGEAKKEFKRPGEARGKDMSQGKLTDNQAGFFKEGSDIGHIGIPKSSHMKEIMCRAKDKKQRIMLNLGAKQGFKLPIPLMSMQNSRKFGSNEGRENIHRKEEENQNLFGSRDGLNQTFSRVELPKNVAKAPLNSNFLRLGKRRDNFFGKAQPIIDSENAGQGKLEDRGVSPEIDEQEFHLEAKKDSFVNREKELSPIEGPSNDIK